MSVPGFLEVDTAVVRQAGEHTTDTAGLWRSWGNRIGISFRYADSALRSPTIFAAMEAYGDGVLPGANRVSQQVYNLGVDTSSAATTVENTDTESAEVLEQQGRIAADGTTTLHREINVHPAAPVDGNPVIAV